MLPIWTMLLLAGCSPADPVHALILTGWEYEWDLLSHRISLLRVDLKQDATVDLGLIGGTYTTGEEGTDTLRYRLGYSDIGVPGAVVTEASATWIMGPQSTDTATVSAAAPEGCDDQIAAYLNGFAIDTDVEQDAAYPADYDPALGYTSNGFGFTLGAPTSSAGTLSVDVTATVRWAPQDRDDMNAAIPLARTEVSAGVLFVCFKGDSTAGLYSGALDYEWDPPYSEQPPMTAAIVLDGDEPDGVASVTGFELGADFTNVDGSAAGDYLRSFGVELTGQDDGKGTWSGDLTAQITNTSAIEYGDLTASYAVELVRIGVRGATSEPTTLDGTHDVGETTLTLDGG